MRAQAEHIRHVFRFEDVEVREAEFSVTKAGERLPLEPKAFKLLLHLLHNPGRLIPKDELLDAVWGDTAVTENSLTRNVAFLRHVLGDDPHEPRYVETVATVGYRFICPVEVVELPQDKADAEFQSSAGNSGEMNEATNSGASRAMAIPPQESGARATRPIFKKWVAWAAGALLAGLALLFWINLFGLRDRVLQKGESPTALALQIQPVTHAPGNAMSPAFSPDGREIAFLWDSPEQKRQEVYVLLLGSDTPLRLTHSTDGVLGAPAWSPDGREIAFSRCRGKTDAVYVVPALGGPERELTDVGCPYTDPGPLAWISNGQEILMIDHCPEAGSFDLVVFSLASGKKRCLTHSGPRNAFDSIFRFSLSPDGRTVAFTASASAPCFGDIYTMPLIGGSPYLLTSEGRCFTELMWTPDGKSIVLGSYTSILPPLWRISVNGGPLERETTYPAIGRFSPDGRRFVYSQQTVAEGPAVWRADLVSVGGAVRKNREVIRTQFEEMGPQTSPDGTRIAWRSNRTGYGQIWTSDASGENPLQLTHLDWYSGTPRWSPDGKWISFNRVTGNGRQIFIVDSEGRGLRQITDGPYENAESSWSRDGRSIYFASMRTGSWQVWKRTLESGAEVQDDEARRLRTVRIL